MLTSCSDSWNETYSDTAFEALVAGDLTVNTESIEFSENAANAQITITTTGFWTVKTSASWVKLSDSKGKNNGSLSVSVEANNITQARETTLAISNGKATKSVRIIQAAMNESLWISTSQLGYSYLGGSDVVRVESNVAWTVTSNATWVSVHNNSDNKGFTVASDPNISTSDRQATITIKGISISHTVIVDQSGVASPYMSEVNIKNVTKHDAECTFSFNSTDLDVTEYGICYSKTSNLPTTSNAQVLKRDDSRKTGNPSFTLIGLDSKTTYYVRSYIVTALGTQYGEVAQFTTPASAPNEDDNKTPQNN